MSVDTLSPARAEDILGQVRGQLRREVLFPVHHTAIRWYSGSPRVWNSGVARRGPTRPSDDVAERVQGLYTFLDTRLGASAAELGEMPAPAPTIRGAAGRVAIGVLQRLLWWYTRSLKHFAGSLGTYLQGSTETIEVLACTVEINRIEIAALRDEIRVLRESLGTQPENRR